MTPELEGKVGIVTGGTSGIGREAAVLFAKAGAKVVVAGRRESEGKDTIDMVRAAGGDGLFVKADVSKASDVNLSFKRQSKNSAASISRSIMPASKASGFRSSNKRKK